MLSALKRKLEAKKTQASACAKSQYWKNHPQLQVFLQSMRGSCTLVPIDLHEALTAVVNIGRMEDGWTQGDLIPPVFLSQTVFILWNDSLLPAFRADRDQLLINLNSVADVASEAFLISETMDRVVHLRQGKLWLYDIAPEDESPGEGCAEGPFAI